MFRILYALLEFSFCGNDIRWAGIFEPFLITRSLASAQYIYSLIPGRGIAITSTLLLSTFNLYKL